MAVIGKVGTYATVQPIQGPDFGGMVDKGLDEIQKRRDLEAAKKNKAEDDKLKAAAGMPKWGTVEMTTLPAVDSQLAKITDNWREQYYQLKEAGKLQEAEKLLGRLSGLNSTMKSVKAKVEYLQKNADKNFNDAYWKKTYNEIQALNDQNVLLEDDGSEMNITLLGQPNEEGKREILAPKQSVSRWIGTMEVPLKFDLNNALEDFKKNNDIDKIESRSGNMFTTVEDVMKDKGVQDNIKSYVSALSNDNSAMAEWYRTSKGDYKAKDFTDQEKQEFINEKYTEYLNSYGKEIGLQLQERRSGGGSGSGDKFFISSPVSLGTNQLPGIVSGGKNVNFDPKQTLVVSVTKKADTKGIDVSGRELSSIVYNPRTKEAYIGVLKNTRTGASASETGSGANVGDSNKEVEYFNLNGNNEFSANFRTKMQSIKGKKYKTNQDVLNDLYNLDEYGIPKE